MLYVLMANCVSHHFVRVKQQTYMYIVIIIVQCVFNY